MKAAIDEFREYIMVKSTWFQRQVPRYQFHEDQPAYGLALARADAAESILLSFADQYTEAGRRACHLAADAVEVLARRATSCTTGRGQKLGRYLRDAHTYRQRISCQRDDFAVRNAAIHLGATGRWTF